MEFTVSSRSAPPAALITIGGDVDVFGAVEVAWRIEEALRAGCRGVWVNGADVTFLDAAACSELARIATVVWSLDAELRLVGASKRFLDGCDLAALQIFDRAGRPAVPPASQVPREPDAGRGPPGPDQHAPRWTAAAHPEG